jgi:altronate hydrolase
MSRILKIHPSDNVVVALQPLRTGEEIAVEGKKVAVMTDIPAKHKMATVPLAAGDPVIMYGALVGRAVTPIPRGGLISTANVVHAAADYAARAVKYMWQPPDVSRFAGRTFDGYHRADGKVGTANYWLVIPLVFCENRNIEVMREALLDELGYSSRRSFRVDTRKLVEQYRRGADVQTILETDILADEEEAAWNRIFPNVEGVKFLTHDGGCGGTRQDSNTLCRLIAGYIANPNVAGATVLSLGCQHAQIPILQETLQKTYPGFDKPVFYLEQQRSASERAFIADAVKKTFAGLMQADQAKREPVPLSKLCIGLECGGSDGFSGISANPALGHASDMIVALGGQAILSEFPELNGVEQELINRCADEETAARFARLMEGYSRQAEAVGSGFSYNPSPGNIRDGLITDAMKSAGAARKGGTSPVVEALDYAEPATRPGLSLLCTPGNDVESTTGLAGSGANIIVFTTGLGTPTGNPVAPTIKVATNTELARRMPDLIDIDAGTIISGQDTIQSKGEEILEFIIRVASGKAVPKAVRLGQDDFIPWKRGVSL